MNNDLNALFDPKSVAIVGVSENTNKIGSVIFENLRAGGYSGKVFPVNPKHSEIRGYKCYSTVSEIEDDVELVCIAIPAAFVKEAIIDAVKKPIKVVIIISSGFAEQGEAGKQLEDEIVAICKAHNVRVLGPNCLGMLSSLTRTNLSFTATSANQGGIAVLSQSGAICTALLDAAAQYSVGFTHLVSVGNQADISDIDLLDYYQNDPAVKVIIAYLEEVPEGLELFKRYSSYEKPKPFIVIKPGRTQEARSAMQSHTGSIANTLSTFHTAAEQYGVITVDSIEDLLNIAVTFERQQIPSGNSVAIITNAGGPGILATDAVVSHGFTLPPLSQETVDTLKKLLPATASVHNPLDLGGDAPAQRYDDALTALQNEKQIDQIVAILTPQFVTQIDETSKVILSHSLLTKKPIFTIYLGGKYTSAGLNYFYDKHRVIYTSLENAVSAMKALGNFAQFEALVSSNQAQWSLLIQKFTRNIELNPQEKLVPTLTTERLAKAFDIPLPPQRIVSTLEEAIRFQKESGKVVLKLLNDKTQHKTEKKGVYTNLASESDLKEAWQKLYVNDSLLIQKQIAGEQELFIGVHKDSTGLGHLLIFGKGGIETEVYKDFGYAVVPTSRHWLIKQLANTKVSKTLIGFRGKKPLAVTKFIQLIESFQKLVLTYPEITSIDCNPVMITENEVYAVDLKIEV